MKIRKGFVSNSSSSSFIVAFDREELTPEYLKEVLYYNAEKVPYVHNWGEERIIFDTNQLCKEICEELEPGTPEKILELTRGCSSYDDSRFPEFPPYNNILTDDERRKQWDEYDKKCNAVAEEIAAEITKQYEGKHVFVVSFSDNDGSMGSQLEHGDTFDAVEYKRISNH